MKKFNEMAAIVKGHSELNKKITEADGTIRTRMAEAYKESIK